MPADFDETEQLLAQRSLYPERSRILRRCDTLAQLAGVAALVVGHGVWTPATRPWEFDAVVLLSMATIGIGISLRYKWSLRRPTFWMRHKAEVFVSLLWALGMLTILIAGPLWTNPGVSAGLTRWHGFVRLSGGLMVLYAAVGIVRLIRSAAAGGANPALLLIVSFLMVIGAGTLALMLPRCRNPVSADGGAPFVTALFTATSATCVTGLVVENTGNYWSRTGQIVIMCLFQIGGLGIMTFGALFAVIAGRGVQLREHATMRELLASEALGDTRQLALSITGFTLMLELVGAALMTGLWPELPIAERGFQGLFHSVSAFCNAGFSLTDDSFVGMGSRWQVWGVVSGLIIVGGIGFPVLSDLFAKGRDWIDAKRSGNARPIRLTVSTRIVLLTTLWLLVSGTVGIYLLELTAGSADNGQPIGWMDAWFQSVTFRTAGFNTVDMGALRPSTKLLAIGLMFIGASPGSTGGGIKTVTFALAVLGLMSTLKGRERLECMGRTIPNAQVGRALSILFLGLTALMTTTILLVLFEHRPEHMLDHMFEAASALGTVGVSSSLTLDTGDVVSITQSLSTASRLVIVLAMFVGRVGPLSVIMALATEARPARYEYPRERVLLG